MSSSDGPPRARASGECGRGLRLVLLLALVLGAGARVVLAFLRPLWADEIFTLALARRGVPELLDALRLDSGPPLHYLAARLLLLPFPSPGPYDVAVRLLSVAASLLHVPLLVRVGRRCGAPRAGAVAAVLFLVFPLSAWAGAEGRGYSLASLLALAAIDRLLALEAEPRARTAVAAGLLGGAAMLTHYLALLPLGGALLAALLRGRCRGPAILAGGVAAATAVPWLPVALGQPRASMAWAGGRSLADSGAAVAANLGLGLSVDADAAWLLGPLAVGLLAVALVTRRTAARVPAAGPLLLSLALLGPLVLFSRAALLPDRTAVLLLPLVALVLAEARPVLPIAAGSAAAAVLVASFPGWLRPTPASELAAALAPGVRAGARVVAAELWGPELDYRLAREGLAGRVTPFPREVARHPGWYDESSAAEEDLHREAGEVVAEGGAHRFFVFSQETRAGRALAGVLGRAGASRVSSAGLFEVWLAPGWPVTPPPARGAAAARH